MIPALLLIAMLMMPVIRTNEIDMTEGSIRNYRLDYPDKTLILPDILREVSGVTIIDSVTVAFIQDEIGILFIYDIRENRIKSQVFFAGKGDYEDLSLVNRTMYVLRSDGFLFEIYDFMLKGFKVNTFKTGIPSSDNEGLFYDKQNSRLLIGCKGDIKKDNFKNKRAIYSFDLRTMKLIPEPVFVFDTESINKFYNKNEVDKKGEKGKKDKKDKKKEIWLRTSAMALHPITGELYLLSAADNILCIFDKAGTIESIQELDKDLFLQAEGIAFFPDGDMLITNEGKNKKPTLLRFNFNPDR